MFTGNSIFTVFGILTSIFFRAYSELLLDSQKSHVRKFAVESFGFLLRKVICKEKKNNFKDKLNQLIEFIHFGF